MIQTSKGSAVYTAKEMAVRMGKKPEDIALTEAQIKRAKKMGLNPEEVEETWAGRDFDQYRISQSEIKARAKSGENLVMAGDDPELDSKPDLSKEEFNAAVRFNVNPTLAKRAKYLDEQNFIPKAERIGKAYHDCNSQDWDNILGKPKEKKENQNDNR